MLPTATTNEDRDRFEEKFQPSNKILPDGDQDIIRDILSTSQHTLDFIDSELSSCPQESQLPLTTRRKKEVVRMERLRTGIAAHKRVPYEILLMIFVGTLGEMPTKVLQKPLRENILLWDIFHMCSRRKPIALRERNTSLWNIIRVCARWRSVALSEACLWKTMALFVDPDHATREPVVPTQVHRFLERLVVQFGTPKNYPIFSFSSKFASCENLREIEMRSTTSFCLSASIMTMFIFPWAQITSLTLSLGDGGVILDAFIAITWRASNLVNLDIVLSFFHFEPRHSTQMRSLRSLRHLTIRNHSYTSEYMNTFFSILILPALETLAILGSLHYHTLDVFPHELKHLLHRSRCRVRHFTMKDVGIHTNHVERYLTALPDLVSCDLGTHTDVFVQA